MNEETKNRITDINNDIIPEGYKKTKVGIVPVEWEVKQIGECLAEYRELSNDIDNYPVYSSSRKGLIPQSDYYDKKEAIQINLGYKIVPVGYVTYRHMSDDDIFHFNLNTTKQAVLVSSEYPVFNAKKNSNLYYIISSLNEMSRFKYFCRTQKLGGTRTRLYFINLSTYRIAFPPLPEQQKIAEILSTQDKLIELQECKINQLKTLKKGYLQKMFPKKSCKYPELRFKGFTDAWEQREFNSVFTMLQNNTLSRAELVADNGAAMNVHYGDILVKFGEVLDVEIETLPYIESEQVVSKFKSSYLQNGDVIVADTAEDEAVGKCTEIANLSNVAVISGLHTIPLRPQQKFASGYLGYYLNSNSYHDTLIPLMQGTKVTSISKSALQGTSICYPTSHEEQQQIGTYFRNLDHLITLHQCKLDEEKQKKKALMQLLLTGKVRVKL